MPEGEVVEKSVRIQTIESLVEKWMRKLRLTHWDWAVREMPEEWPNSAEAEIDGDTSEVTFKFNVTNRFGKSDEYLVRMVIDTTR